MKKTLLVFILSVIFLSLKSQITYNAYTRPLKVYYHQYIGTRADYVQTIVDLNLDSSYCSYTPSLIVIDGFGAYPGDYIFKRTSLNGYIEILPAADFWELMTNDFSDVWESVKNNYSTTSQANSLYKSASYQPSLTVAGYSLSAGGNTVVIPAQTTLTGSTNITVSGSAPNYTVSSPSQSLSIAGSTISLTAGGGSVVVPTGTNYSSGTGISITSGTITNTAPDQTVAITGTNGITATGTYPNFTVGRTSSTFSTPSRSLSTNGTNNTFTVSAREAFVSYSINFSVALVAALSNGQVDLDYSTNGGSSWVNVASVSQVFGVSITITTNTNQVLWGKIPAGALVRLNRTQNTNVTTTIVRQQEVAD